MHRKKCCVKVQYLFDIVYFSFLLPIIIGQEHFSIQQLKKYAKETNVYFTVKILVNVAKQGNVQKGTPVFTLCEVCIRTHAISFCNFDEGIEKCKIFFNMY
jgi:hypothetical protein